MPCTLRAPMQAMQVFCEGGRAAFTSGDVAEAFTAMARIAERECCGLRERALQLPWPWRGSSAHAVPALPAGLDANTEALNAHLDLQASSEALRAAAYQRLAEQQMEAMIDAMEDMHRVRLQAIEKRAAETKPRHCARAPSLWLPAPAGAQGGPAGHAYND